MTDVYMTYEEYLSYGGTLSESAYPVAEFRARSRIDWLTDGRVKPMAEVPEAVKLAELAIIQTDSVAGVSAQADAPLVASFNTDGYSESYGSAESRTAVLESQLTAEVSRLLYGVTDDNGVPLLYRGVIT